MVIRHLKQIRKVKRLNKWMPHEVTAKWKCHHFWVSSLILIYNNSESFLSQIVMYNKKWILYDNHWQAIQWLDWQEAPKHCLKPNLAQNKSWSLFGSLLPIWPTTASCIPAKPLHLVSMLRKLRRCTKTPTPAASIGQQNGPDSPPQRRLTTGHRTGASRVLPHSPHSPDLLLTNYT